MNNQLINRSYNINIICKISLTLLQAVKSYPLFWNNCANRTLSSMWLPFFIHCNTDLMSRCLCVQWTGLVLQAAKRLQINMYLTQLPGMKWVPTMLLWLPVNNTGHRNPYAGWASRVLSDCQPPHLCPSPRECLSRCVPVPYIEYLSRCVLVLLCPSPIHWVPVLLCPSPIHWVPVPLCPSLIHWVPILLCPSPIICPVMS